MDMAIQYFVTKITCEYLMYFVDTPVLSMTCCKWIWWLTIYIRDKLISGIILISVSARGLHWTEYTLTPGRTVWLLRSVLPFEPQLCLFNPVFFLGMKSVLKHKFIWCQIEQMWVMFTILPVTVTKKHSKLSDNKQRKTVSIMILQLSFQYSVI